MHHLPLGSDWPSAGEYGGCTHSAFSEYLHYSLQLYKNKMQVDFHLTFIVDTKLKPDAKIRLVVVVK